jgi:hypothetical protein
LVLPCVADESLFFFSPDLRSAARAELNYALDDIVLAYVGSTNSYQCIPETVLLMMEAMQASAGTRALVVTPNGAEFVRMFPTELRTRVTIVSGSLGEINRLLNAADYGLLLREPNPINYVASPVKFAEYSLTGLTVIATRAVHQVGELGQFIGNTLNAHEALARGLRLTQAEVRMSIAARARLVLGRRSHMKKVVDFYKTVAQRTSEPVT